MGLVLTEETDFFMVWTKRGHKPRFTHASYEAALAEAIRLAGEHPGEKFIVLKAITKLHVRREPVSAQSFGI